MLVLSRKVGEKIVIGENVTVVVQRIGKGRVALAIEAPHEVPVLRGELAPFGLQIDGEGPVQIEDLVEEEEEYPAPEKNQVKGTSRGRQARTQSVFPRTSTPLNPTTDTSLRTHSVTSR